MTYSQLLNLACVCVCVCVYVYVQDLKQMVLAPTYFLKFTALGFRKCISCIAFV